MSAITSLVKENIGILSGSKTTDDCMWGGREGGKGRREGGREGKGRREEIKITCCNN